MLINRYPPLLSLLLLSGCQTAMTPCGTDGCAPMVPAPYEAQPQVTKSDNERFCARCLEMNCLPQAATVADTIAATGDSTIEDKGLGEALLETAEAINEGIHESQKTLAVKSRLASIETNFHTQLELTVDADKVILTGQLEHLSDVEQAVLACLDAEGIEMVDVSGVNVTELDLLRADSKLNALVMYQLGQHSDLTKGISSVKDDVFVRNGVVNIQAKIQNYGQRRKLSKLLKAIPGIKGITISSLEET